MSNIREESSLDPTDLRLLDHLQGLGQFPHRGDSRLVDAVRRRWVQWPHTVLWCGPSDGPNPYAGLLAWADRIVCTPDSVNMLSEACGTRAPVQVFEPDRVGGRPRRFMDALLRHGRVRDLADGQAPFGGEPLRETARIAAEVRARLHLPDR